MSRSFKGESFYESLYLAVSIRSMWHNFFRNVPLLLKSRQYFSKKIKIKKIKNFSELAIISRIDFLFSFDDLRFYVYSKTTQHL